MSKKRLDKFTPTEEALILLTNGADNNNFILSEMILKIKAARLARKLGKNEFDVNNGWLYKFKRRNHIKLRIRFGKTRGQTIDNF